jgi:outer membrane immunogenic protein
VKNRILSSLTLTVATLAFFTLATRMQAQAHPAATGHSSPEISLQYTYIRSNAPVAECGCFGLNGGSFSVAQPLGSGHIAAVFEATVAHGSFDSTETSSEPVDSAAGPQVRAQTKPSPNATGPTVTYDLTLTVLTAGARYRPMLHSKWNPFGQVLVGVANASGSLVDFAPAVNDSPLSFASQLGGGLDYRMKGHFSLRIFEANYLVTTATNGVNDHQNNIFLSSGITYRFRKQ